MYECLASAGIMFEQKGVHVGNATVNRNVTWVLTQFPNATMTPTFVTKLLWYENPAPCSQNGKNLTMSILTLNCYC